MARPKVLVLYGYGINCDNETQFGFELAGADAKKVHINELINKEKKLKDFQILALPGGFSFGDDIAAGKVLANKLKYNLQEELYDFIKQGKLIIGICNGFQAMVRVGIFPGATLAFNDSGKFEDRWVYLTINQESKCIWTKGIEKLFLPIRHGEGKFISKNKEIRAQLKKSQQIVLQYYPYNPNGSQDNIAGICDETGRLFGMMPHPEGFLLPQNHPRWTREEVRSGQGLKIFKNAVNFYEKI